MSFPKYSEYKDSGVEWLGEVPAHWSVSRLGFEAWVRARLGWKGLKAEEYTDDGYVFLSTPNIKGRNIDFHSVNYISRQRFEESPEIKLRAGDVLLAKDGSTLGTVNFVRSLPRPATVNSSIALLTPYKRLDGLFLRYLFDSSFMRGKIASIKGGMGVPHLFQADLNKFFLPLPNIEEQVAIATFLDHETARIDDLVEQQQRLIELLKEKRQAMISHAVTKGLDPDVPMKDSGVEWLGEVPVHWDVVPTGYRYEVQLGRMLNETRASGKNLKPYLRVFDVQWGVINTQDLPLMDFPPSAQETYRLEAGDLMVNEGGSYVGRSAIWRGELSECYYQKALHRLRPRLHTADTADYFLYVMEMATQKGVFVANANQTTIDHLTAEQLRSHRFAFPPLGEQKEIARYLENATNRLECLTEEAQGLIKLLRERRSALISAAVTGKIDVRGWQPPAGSLAPAEISQTEMV